MELHEDAIEVLHGWLNSQTSVDGLIIDLADVGIELMSDRAPVALKRTIAFCDLLLTLLGGSDFEEPGGKIAQEIVLNARSVREMAVAGLGSAPIGPIEAADVFDKMSNPHPRMWAEAKGLFTNRNASNVAKARWETALQMMCAATGYDESYFIEKLAAEL